MKNTTRKILSITTILILVISFIQFTNAFPKMDVCNYTNGDHSGDYYDGLCTKDGKAAEKDNVNFSKNQNNNKNTTKVQKKHKLKEVKHYTGSAFFTNPRQNTQMSKLNKIIEEQKNIIEKKDIVINNLKRELEDKNKTVLNYKKEVEKLNKEKNNLLKIIYQVSNENIVLKKNNYKKNYKKTTIINNTVNKNKLSRKEEIEKLIRERIIRINKRASEK